MPLSADFLARALSAAQRAADAADAIVCERFQRQDFHVVTKADDTPVTEADREAEQAIKRCLAGAFPDHAFLGEEEGQQGNSEFLWLIDPIDGTKAFVRGYPFFSTQIALSYAGKLVLGVSSAAVYGERAWAVQGGGAWLARGDEPARRIHVSRQSTFGPQAAISTGNLRTLAADPVRWQKLAGLITRVGRIRGYGDFLHYHLLARGALELVIESDLNILDIAALVVIVREAGGVFTDLDGGDIDLATRSALAGPSDLHAEALKWLRADS